MTGFKMKPSPNTIVHEISPPILVKLLRRLRSTPSRTAQPAGEKDSGWYDRAFEDNPAHDAHYTESPYYPIWTVILDRVRTETDKSILEVACGTGQLARALLDRGLIDSYYGFDFSPKRIHHAQRVTPELKFEVQDAFGTDVYDTVRYRMLIATEFLEHVQDDLLVLRRLRRGTRFIGTVPNYPWKSHLRHFKDVPEVASRYGELFTGLDIVPILRKKTGETIFVMDGWKK
jgi:SAM-dependent methyltransferase